MKKMGSLLDGGAFRLGCLSQLIMSEPLWWALTRNSNADYIYVHICGTSCLTLCFLVSPLGSIFVLYTPLEPSVFSLGGIAA
jgi:hypothetical protein